MVPQLVDLQAYLRNTPGRIDYIVLWGANETFEGEKLNDKQTLLEQLSRDYTLIYATPSNRTQLWRLSK
jgi:hypothetical protein